MKIQKLIRFLICPGCSCPKLEIISETQLKCPKCQKKYPVVSGIPVLINKSKLSRQEIKQTKWFEKHYSKFSDTKYKIENWRISMLNRIFNHPFLKEVKFYLDIGCGATGYTVIEAVKKRKWTSLGTDISLSAMIKAKHLAEIQGVSDKTGFLVCTAENLPFQKRTFDYISAVSLLEHLKNDKKALSQINSKLKNKGFLFICVPNSYLHIWPFLWLFYYFNDLKIGHQRHYSINQLNRLLNKNFILKKIIYNGHLIKFFQLFLEKIHKINDKYWWHLEKKDLNKNNSGVQLNAVYQKQ